MLKSKTLLILGAGASKEAELPIGTELMPAILKAVRVEARDFGAAKMEEGLRRALATQARALNTALSNTEHLYAAAWRKMNEGLKLSISIDNYLDAHQDDHYLQVLGKIGIAQSILRAESESTLSVDDRDRCDLLRISSKWYSELFKLMIEGVGVSSLDNFFQNLEVISFNYDRCVEHFFERALRSYYSIDAGRAAEVVSRLTVFHPYGQVGYLPWQRPNQATPYGGRDTDGAELLRLATQIKTFTERQDDNDFVGRMRHAVQSAETIVFLGFAFHPQNLELIAPNHPARAERIFASAFGMSKPDIEATREDIAHWLQRSSRSKGIEIGNLTCSQLFAEYRRSIPRA